MSVCEPLRRGYPRRISTSNWGTRLGSFSGIRVAVAPPGNDDKRAAIISPGRCGASERIRVTSQSQRCSDRRYRSPVWMWKRLALDESNVCAFLQVGTGESQYTAINGAREDPRGPALLTQLSLWPLQQTPSSSSTASRLLVWFRSRLESTSSQSLISRCAQKWIIGYESYYVITEPRGRIPTRLNQSGEVNGDFPKGETQRRIKSLGSRSENEAWLGMESWNCTWLSCLDESQWQEAEL